MLATEAMYQAFRIDTVREESCKGDKVGKVHSGRE